jgi:hypothetical protein
MIKNQERRSPMEKTQIKKSQKERNWTENIKRARRNPIKGQLGKLMNPMIQVILGLNLNLDQMRLQIG